MKKQARTVLDDDDDTSLCKDGSFQKDSKEDEIRQLKACVVQLVRLWRQNNKKEVREDGSSPFSEAIIEADFLDNFKASSIDKFDRTTNLNDHICTFERYVDVLKVGIMARCKLFLIYLAVATSR